MAHVYFSSLALSPLITMIMLTATLTSCGDDSDRREQIKDLRALGVEQSPLVAVPGSAVNLTFYLAAPQGKNITPTPYLDTAVRYGLPATVTLVDTKPVEQKLGTISQYTLRATYTVPTDALTTAAIVKTGSFRQRYGVAFDDGTRNEIIVGDIVVYAADSAQQKNWTTAPTITIDQPLTSDVGSTNNISSTITNSIDETNKVSWFVSSGKVKNASAKSTEWSDIGSGEQTLIVTTRGKKSGAFAIKTMKVTVH